MEDFYFEFSKDIVTSNFKEIDEDEYAAEIMSNLSITDYSYDSSTDELKFNFSFDIDADYNSTGFDLNYAGEVNLIVFERIEQAYGGPMGPM